jgi:hypothetical protein
VATGPIPVIKISACRETAGNRRDFISFSVAAAMSIIYTSNQESDYVARY